MSPKYGLEALPLRIHDALHHVERAHLYSAQMVERMQGQALQMVERLHMQSNY